MSIIDKIKTKEDFEAAEKEHKKLMAEYERSIQLYLDGGRDPAENMAEAQAISDKIAELSSAMRIYERSAE